MAFLAVLGIVGVISAIGNTRPEQVPQGILLPALFIAPIALVVSAAVGGTVGALFGIVDLGLFALARVTGGNAKPTV
jgi:hypothetical protein